MRSATKGFTLIELLVVLVILGLLAGLIGPQVMKYVGSSKTKTAHLQIEDLSVALDLYRLELGRYPDTGKGLSALVAAPSGSEYWNGPYLRESSVPLDPWGNPYHYRFPGRDGRYELFSLGADNAEGGDGENADITSWQ